MSYQQRLMKRLVAEMRTIALVAGQCSVEGGVGVESLMAAAEADRCARWADDLEQLIAPLVGGGEERRQEQQHEKVKDLDTRIGESAS